MKDTVPIHPYKPPGREITLCNEGGIQVARGASAFDTTNDDLDAVMRMYDRVRGWFPGATTYAAIYQCKYAKMSWGKAYIDFTPDDLPSALARLARYTLRSKIPDWADIWYDPNQPVLHLGLWVRYDSDLRVTKTQWNRLWKGVQP